MVELQSWHFDAVLSRGSPFHSLNPDASPAALHLLVSGGGGAEPVSFAR
jgi:hypothetical protein